MTRGEFYEIPSEESHPGEPSTKRNSQLEKEEDIYDNPTTNDSNDDVMDENEAFESSGDDANEPTMDFFNIENAVSYVAVIFLHNNFSDSVAKDIFHAHVVARISSISSAKSSKFALNDLKKRLLEIPHIFPGEGIFCRVHLGEVNYSTPPRGTGSSNQLMNIFKTIFLKLVSPQYLIWTISYRPNSGRRDDKHFDRFPETLVTVLKDFGMDAIANYIPTRLLPADADMDEKFVKRLTYPFEEACKKIVRPRNSYESADKLVRHAIHGALQLLRTYHYDTANGILVNCKKRSECSTHLTWKDYKSKLEVGDQDA
ncbi:hypothetical protein L5515_010752 [Caenorhabditis briggsae]|uniref:Uncharacterized protein n=1 Tax=Caenorhabditis briggsae TaxID=6238 RepID=A0AAE9EUK3_CAEBR|nr:hypothetical protein L5515_010752 [Caenorhabditis briggsae]